MSAPRLLDKKIVNAEVAAQTKQKIDDGIKLSKKVDAVRETLGEEEARLESFRKETIARIQKEIDTKFSEKDLLERGNIVLREERIRLLSPVDLREEWEKLNKGKEEITEWNNRLTIQSIEFLAKEGENEIRTKELDKIEKNAAKKDELAERNLSEAEIKFTQADDTLQRATRESEKMLSDARIVENHLKVREQDATGREKYLSEREERNQSHEIDLANREKKLRLAQQVFIKAQNYIKNKKS